MRPLAAEEKKKPIKSHIYSQIVSTQSKKKYDTLEKMTSTNATILWYKKKRRKNLLNQNKKLNIEDK